MKVYFFVDSFLDGGVNSRVAKCQIFYTEENFKLNLPEEKRVNRDNFGT